MPAGVLRPVFRSVLTVAVGERGRVRMRFPVLSETYMTSESVFHVMLVGIRRHVAALLTFPSPSVVQTLEPGPAKNSASPGGREATGAVWVPRQRSTTRSIISNRW